MDHFEQFSVLIVDDKLNIELGLAKRLMTAAESIETAVDADEALEKFDHKKHSLVILDVRLNGKLDGLHLLKLMMQSRPQTAVIVITAHDRVETAVDAMKAGARDYLLKPIDFNTVYEQVRKASQHYKLQPAKPRMHTSLAEVMDACERNTIQMALEACNLHRENTAKMLGISVRSLHYKMARYGIS